jgi:hypothetical protein
MSDGSHAGPGSESDSSDGVSQLRLRCLHLIYIYAAGGGLVLAGSMAACCLYRPLGRLRAAGERRYATLCYAMVLLESGLG